MNLDTALRISDGERTLASPTRLPPPSRISPWAPASIQEVSPPQAAVANEVDCTVNLECADECKLEHLVADLQTTANAIRDTNARQTVADRKTVGDSAETSARPSASNAKHQPVDLFSKLNNLAGKVAELAGAMEKLEIRDRDIAARAAGRLAASRMPAPAR